MGERFFNPAKNAMTGGENAPLDQGSHRPLRQRIEDRIWNPPETSRPRRLPAFVQRWLQILDRSFSGYITDKGPANASSLTYTSILTIVPLLAVLLAVLKGFGVHEAAHDALKQLPFVQEVRIDLGPVGHDEIGFSPPGALPSVGGQAGGGQAGAASHILTGSDLIDKVYEFVNKANFGNLGYIGLLGLLWAIFSLLGKIERAMNEAWAVRRSRPWSRKFSDYINMLVISLLLILGLSATATGSFAVRFTGLFAELGFNAAERFLLRAIPYLTVWLAFIIMYFYIPNTRVRWRSAVISGLLAGTIFQVAQVLFFRSQMIVTRYKIYGAFAVLLILLAWLYLSWSIVLWGAEVCSAHQNLRDWRRRRRAWLGTPVERETLALRLAALLSTPLMDLGGDTRLDVGDLADMLRLPPGPVGEMLELFCSQGLAVQAAEDGSFHFARSPESVSVLDLLRLVRQGDLKPPVPEGGKEGGMLAALSGEIAQPLQNQTVKDLVRLPLEDIRTFTF